MSSATASTPKSAPTRHRRKPTAENWDDDFEFALPSRPTSNATSKSKSKGVAKDEGAYGGDDTGRPIARRRSSPTENWAEAGWDDSPPGPSRLSYHARHPKQSTPTPLNLAAGSLQPPRLSPSPTSPLPSPDARSPNSSTPHSSHSTIASRPLLPSAINGAQPSRSGSGSGSAATSKNKLIKRHPSTGFISVLSTQSWDESPSPDGSPAGLYPPKALYHSKSTEQMPPPPVPFGTSKVMGRSKSRSHMREGDDGDDLEGLPISPSMDDIRGGQGKKRGFWKRMSGMPSKSGTASTFAPMDQRRRRSFSVGTRLPSDAAQHPPMPPLPPLPPLPPNLRSPSAASAASSSSVNSAGSSLKKGPVSAITSMLRRSSSSLSKRSKDSSKTLPSAYQSASRIHKASSSSLQNNAVSPPLPSQRSRSERESPVLPSSSSFSRGFHLPSPLPQSPYNRSSSALPDAKVGLGVPSLPHSPSFHETTPGRHKLAWDTSDSETEPEGDDVDVDRTPRRRKKIRPVSALPAPRTRPAWDGEEWQGFPLPGSDSRQPSSSSVPAVPEMPSPRPPSSASNGFAATTASTLRRLGSLSKKHGRRISGGWKFGTNSSTSSNESKKRDSTLEPVLGSPSESPRPPLPTAPTAPSTVQATKPPVLESKSIGESVISEAQRKAEKQRRRQSWNDFVIPTNVLEKQKGLKENIGAVKMFAGGIETLRSLLNAHAEVREKVTQSGQDRDLSLFSQLEQEFAQYWEMATVLIEVGSTGQSALQSAQSSPTRSRRVTLASDEAKAMGNMMRSASGRSSDLLTLTPRKTSLPDPQDMGDSRPPRISPPDQWRASTGRQDLSKRQLEVLRTMLRTPASDPARPTLGSRQSSAISTVSARSAQSEILHPGATATMRHASRPFPPVRTDTERSDASQTRSRLPSDESSYVIPSPNYSTEGTADLSRQAKRRSSKAGLAGLKDFLRSLRNQRSEKGTRTPSKLGIPNGLARNASDTSNATSASRHASPPASPTSPTTHTLGRGEQVSYPTSRSTFSALGPPSQRKVRNPSPTKDEVKRPSIRNIFRTSSGNWSELVRGEKERKEKEAGRNGGTTDGKPSTDETTDTKSTTLSATMRHVPLASTAPRTAPPRPSSDWPGSGNDAMPDLGLSQVDEGSRDETVRPGRKSRIVGLGWPDEALPPVPATPPGLQKEREPPTSPTSPLWAGFPKQGNTSPAKTRQRDLKTVSDLPEMISRANRISPEGEEGGEYRAQEEQQQKRVGTGDADDVVVALTPENLPVLLEYLRQCEGKLKEWRVRAEAISSGQRD